MESTWGRWRSKLWPIHRFELKKILPLVLMKFLISLNYAILTCMKDAMVVTAKGSGAEVIPVLKGWAVLPISILATFAYAKLSNHLRRSTLYYATLGFFLAFIFLYGFALYPHLDALSPHASADKLQAWLGDKGSHWVAVYRNWIPSLFFVIAELWGGIVIFILFWGFMNQITPVSEAKRTYTLYIAAGDLASIVTGPIIWQAAERFAQSNFTFTLQALVSLVVCSGLIIMAIHHWVTTRVLQDPRLANAEWHTQEKKTNRLSLMDSLRHIVSSKYLLSIAIMVIGYGLTINMIEVSWKANVKFLYPDTLSYQTFMGMITTFIGIAAFIVVILFGGGIIRIFGWRFSAQITPIVVGCTGILFFGLLLLKPLLSPWLQGTALLSVIVAVGAFQNIASKVMKYSFFDPTKEMAFIPLDQESKTKGKAAIDVVGARLGKSGSAWIQVGLIDLLGTGSILSITHLLMPIVLIAVAGWIIAVRYVNRHFAGATHQKG